MWRIGTEDQILYVSDDSSDIPPVDGWHPLDASKSEIEVVLQSKFTAESVAEEPSKEESYDLWSAEQCPRVG